MPVLHVVPGSVSVMTTNPPAVHTPVIVGSDPWDSDLATYTYTASTAFNKSGQASGFINSTDLATLAAAVSVDSVTCNLTVKYDDDASATLDDPLLAVILGDWTGGTGTLLELCRQGADPFSRDAFHLDDNLQNSYTSDTWALLNSSTLASGADLAAALSSGQVTVIPPITNFHGSGWSTYSWVYALSFDISYTSSSAGWSVQGHGNAPGWAVGSVRARR